MTDPSGRTPEERLPARRPPSEPAPVERFTAPRQAHDLALTPERAAKIVSQSASARTVGFLATGVVILFVILYYFYELGAPLGLTTSRLDVELEHQQVVKIERGYNIYQANCARCHGVEGEGGIGPVLNSQDKLYLHLSPAYLRTVLEVGGRYVCGNSQSIMPIWSDQGSPPGPLNYRQIEELIAFLRAPNTQEYEIRDPELNEPLHDPETGEVLAFEGWVDPDYRPAPDATPVPACWTDTGGGPATPAPSVPPDAVTLEMTASGIAFLTKSLEAPAGQSFAIEFINQDPPGVIHDVDIRETDGTTVVQDQPTIDGGETATYVYEPLEAGEYVFICSIHPIPAMTGTLTVTE
jgi:mono/diheme cytochrome c family protein/plastocyanin